MVGFAVGEKMLHGHVGEVAVVNVHEYGADIGTPAASTTSLTVAVYTVAWLSGVLGVSVAEFVAELNETVAGTAEPEASVRVIDAALPSTGLPNEAVTTVETDA